MLCPKCHCGHELYLNKQKTRQIVKLPLRLIFAAVYCDICGNVYVRPRLACRHLPEIKDESIAQPY
jgi:hypothetical protein